jgi:hypothetical protein
MNGIAKSPLCVGGSKYYNYVIAVLAIKNR